MTGFLVGYANGPVYRWLVILLGAFMTFWDFERTILNLKPQTLKLKSFKLIQSPTTQKLNL